MMVLITYHVNHKANEATGKAVKTSFTRPILQWKRHRKPEQE